MKMQETDRNQKQKLPPLQTPPVPPVPNRAHTEMQAAKTREREREREEFGKKDPERDEFAREFANFSDVQTAWERLSPARAAEPSLRRSEEDAFDVLRQKAPTAPKDLEREWQELYAQDAKGRDGGAFAKSTPKPPQKPL